MLGELVLLSFKRDLENLVPCDGRELKVDHYLPLFSLIGTVYGGNGVGTFRVPKIVDSPVPGSQWYIHVTDDYPEFSDVENKT